MKKMKQFLAVTMSFCLFLMGFAPRVSAAEAARSAESTKSAETVGEGKYLRDIFVAYGKTEEEAKQWLANNGWEPVKGNSNVGLGKASAFDDEIASVIGIRRTDKADEAITDMAVMNMKGGYSLAAYQDLLAQKKAQIDDYISHFFPVIEEYRDNYNGKGSALGKKRADLVYSLLNKFYDGKTDGDYAVNDTGMKLGDLFLSPLKQELEEGAYEKLSAEEKLQHGDLQQLLLESSGPAMTIIRQLLALAADTGEDTWLQRLSSLSGDDLKKNIGKYVPEAAGQDLAPSAITQILDQHFQDLASDLSSQWEDIHVEMVWFEQYCTDNGLWPEDKETAEKYTGRVKKYFEDLEKKDPDRYTAESSRFNAGSILYENLFEITYKGEWGQTLGDFFHPLNKKNYGTEENFLPFAAALSEGQRSAAELISLNDLLLTGVINEAGFAYAVPDIEKVFKENGAGSKEMDIYIGINRAMFRNGVALTNKAMMEQNIGRGSIYDDLFGNLGILAISAYGAAVVGVSMMIAGGVMIAKGSTRTITTVEETIEATTKNINEYADLVEEMKGEIEFFSGPGDELQLQWSKNDYERYKKIYETLKKGKNYEEKTTETITGPSIAGRWLMGIGGALLVAAAGVEAWQLYMYYQKDMTPIPRMIVDEADIVFYEVDESGKQKTDENGDPVKNINFDQFVYYSAVKCNRPEVGEISDWQSGVKEYQEAGCYDIADLNGDYGQEWLALYKNYSLKKGDPILADSLTLQYGSDTAPANAPNGLHFFTYTYAADLGDTAYSFNNKQNGIYLFWNADADAGAKARAAEDGSNAGKGAAGSTFSAGQFALGIGTGILICLCGAAVTLILRRRKAMFRDE